MATTTIITTINKAYFGEPSHVHGVIEDVVTAGLGASRSELLYTYVRDDFDMPEAAIVITINAPGNATMSEQLVAAMAKTVLPATFTFAVHFTSSSSSAALNTEAMEDAVKNRRSGITRHSNTVADFHANRTDYVPPSAYEEREPSWLSDYGIDY